MTIQLIRLLQNLQQWKWKKYIFSKSVWFANSKIYLILHTFNESYVDAEINKFSDQESIIIEKSSANAKLFEDDEEDEDESKKLRVISTTTTRSKNKLKIDGSTLYFKWIQWFAFCWF